MRRVVITGWGALTPIGNDAESIVTALRTSRSGIRAMPEWNSWADLHTKVDEAVGVASVDPLLPAIGQFPAVVGFAQQ